MNRKHNKKFYLSIVEKLKKINEKIKFSSDFIVGYPEESEIDFKETVDLIKRVGFVNSYSFIFSPRPGTPADAKKLNDLTINQARLKELQNILEGFQIQNNKNYLKKKCKVLVENKLNSGKQYFGRTEYMTPVIIQSSKCVPGEIIDVEITSFNQKNLFGLCDNNQELVA